MKYQWPLKILIAVILILLQRIALERNLLDLRLSYNLLGFYILLVFLNDLKKTAYKNPLLRKAHQKVISIAVVFFVGMNALFILGHIRPDLVDYGPRIFLLACVLFLIFQVWIFFKAKKELMNERL